MSFTSVTFIFFVLISLFLYYLLPRKWQWYILLILSYGFYMYGGGKTVLYLLAVTALSYGAGILLGRLNTIQADAKREKNTETAERIKREKKLIVAAVLFIDFGLLFVLKYWNFTVEVLNPIIAKISPSRELKEYDFLMPLGISFFIFQSVGYVIDVYRGKYEPQRNPLKLALFTSFFPQMVQGPIGRYNELGPRLISEHKFNADNVKYGIQLVIWGYFKKLIIADRAAVLVNTVFGSYNAYSGSIVAVSVVFYCIQLYCDFSGGIDIARGVSQMFGIELAENFKQPLFATSLADFWRRWHISLGAWMRDYVFYSLSLSKPFIKLGKFTRKHIKGKLGKMIPTSLATFIVYFIIGVWHGANFKYIAYGFWNGTIITLSLILAPQFIRIKEKLHIRDDSKIWHIFQIARTSFIVFIGRYITRAPQLKVALALIKRTFTVSEFHLHQLWSGTLLTLGITFTDILVVLLAAAVMIGVEFYQEKGGHVRLALERKNGFVQWLAIFVPLLVILLFGIMREGYISSGFIYSQF